VCRSLAGKRCDWWSVGLFALSLLASRAAHGQKDESTVTGVAETAAGDPVAVVEVQRALFTARRQLETGSVGIALGFADDSDWIGTTSGEWVRGKIDWMRDDNMEFDSDEFGALEINMREVAEVHAASVNTYVFDDRSALVGPAMLTTTQIAVQTESGVVVRPRSKLSRIIEGGARELDNWSFDLDLGLGLNRGNSNQLDFNMRVDFTREDRRTLSELGYFLNLGYADRALNVARHVAVFRNRVWLSRLWFVEPIVGQLLSDRFQDIRFRAQPAVAGGVRFLRVPSKALWDLAVGFGYQYNRLLDPAPGVENPANDGLTRFETRARFDFTPDVYLTLMWVTNLTFTTLGNTNHTGFAELFFEVTNILSLQASFLYLRTEEPRQRANDTVPVKNDYFFTLGVSLTLG
jgi:hypothetical protein